MILAILQARLSSSRLPGKVLAPILGRPMIGHQIERASRARLVDRLVVATSVEASDDPLVEYCSGLGVAVARGSLNDVLNRFYAAALPYRPRIVVRLTGDCPLTDPAIIDRVAAAVDGGIDYACNTLPPTWPDGLDVEAFTFAALETAWREARRLSQREHVTPFINGNPRRFRLANVAAKRDLSGLRLTVDHPVDLEVVRRVFEAIYPVNPAFSFDDVAAFLDGRPDLVAANGGIVRNEGLVQSLARDVAPSPDASREPSP